MSMINCQIKCNCALAAIFAGAIIGVITAFLQITGVITVAPVFLWVVFGIAVAYLGILAVATALNRGADTCGCRCSVLNTVLAGILGSILLAVVLLAVGIVATSILSAILVGALLFFLTLTIAGTACFVRCLADCGN